MNDSEIEDFIGPKGILRCLFEGGCQQGEPDERLVDLLRRARYAVSAHVRADDCRSCAALLDEIVDAVGVPPFAEIYQQHKEHRRC